MIEKGTTSLCLIQRLVGGMGESGSVKPEGRKPEGRML